jgi:hypothetical protein
MDIGCRQGMRYFPFYGTSSTFGHIRTASDREHAVAGNLGWRIVLDTTIINIVVSNQLATISGPYLHVS